MYFLGWFMEVRKLELKNSLEGVKRTNHKMFQLVHHGNTPVFTLASRLLLLDGEDE